MKVAPSDHRGNCSTNKLMSIRLPSSAVIVKLSCYFKLMSAKAAVQWTPRSAYYEETSSRAKLESLQWDVLHAVLDMGRKMEDDKSKSRSQDVSPAQSPQAQTAQVGKTKYV